MKIQDNFLTIKKLQATIVEKQKELDIVEEDIRNQRQGLLEVRKQNENVRTFLDFLEEQSKIVEGNYIKERDTAITLIEKYRNLEKSVKTHLETQSKYKEDIKTLEKMKKEKEEQIIALHLELQNERTILQEVKNEYLDLQIEAKKREQLLEYKIQELTDKEAYLEEKQKELDKREQKQKVEQERLDKLKLYLKKDVTNNKKR